MAGVGSGWILLLGGALAWAGTPAGHRPGGQTGQIGQAGQAVQTVQTAQAVPVASAVPAASALAEIKGSLPDGSSARVRLVFKQGVQVEAQALPDAFLAKSTVAMWAGFGELSPAGKRWALGALFPADVWGRERVLHRVRWPQLESVWLMASLFLGHGQRYDQLQAANPGNAEKLRRGDRWMIPKALLAEDLGGHSEAPEALRVQVQPEDGLDDEARVAAFRAMLAYEQDDQGKYAGYHLRKGEALYSSVVMRYTDQVDPQGVNDLALAIARRSGIADVRGIQPGQLVKIPLEALASPFQPEGTVALAEEREMRDEVRRIPRVAAGTRLKGVRIVLDAGHGGVDKGAMANGVWESDYVYDITMRVRRLLEQDTEAMVSCTIRYPGIGFNIRSKIPAPTDDAEILTTPPFANDGDSPIAVSVHLRWVLANHLFANFVRGGDAQKTLFMSFHADSLHPSARGTMVYVPGAVGVPATFTLPPSRGARVKELASSGQVRFTALDRLQGEARSRQFAESMLDALQEAGIPTHENRPIRNVVLRGGKSFIPAVIRYSTAATKVLLEVLNLTNVDDAGNLQDPDFRDRYAQAIVKGIQAYYRK
jgi:N-acetylmuramoyl-L-alanine amidase